MKLHRFYVVGVHDKAGQLQLSHHVWVHDKYLLNQWLRVLRLKSGDQVILFDNEYEKLYRIINVESAESVNLELVTDIERKLPKNHIYLIWSLLKKDKNDWVLQKATELGVKNFVPIIADRSEKTGFNRERAMKIVTEAAEQCGRADIPDVREPIYLKEAMAEYKDIDLLVCEQGGSSPNNIHVTKAGVLIGPEGGWSDPEKQLFEANKVSCINISPFTLRAETAAVIAAASLTK